MTEVSTNVPQNYGVEPNKAITKTSIYEKSPQHTRRRASNPAAGVRRSSSDMRRIGVVESKSDKLKTFKRRDTPQALHINTRRRVLSSTTSNESSNFDEKEESNEEQ